jgi:hypothetical protein
VQSTATTPYILDVTLLPDGDLLVGGVFATAAGGDSAYFARYTFGDVAPTVLVHPEDSAVCRGDSTELAALAQGSGVISYQWQFESSPPGSELWTDIADGPLPGANGTVVAGSNDPVLRLSGLGARASLRLRCVFANDCGSAISDPAVLSVSSPDFDGDGDEGTDADVEAFFTRIAGGPCPTGDACNSTDFDGDGDEGTDADVEAFFRVLAGGAC